MSISPSSNLSTTRREMRVLAAFHSRLILGVYRSALCPARSVSVQWSASPRLRPKQGAMLFANSLAMHSHKLAPTRSTTPICAAAKLHFQMATWYYYEPKLFLCIAIPVPRRGRGQNTWAPFRVIEKLGPVIYRIKLPPSTYRAHNVVHISKLKPYYRPPMASMVTRSMISSMPWAQSNRRFQKL